MNNVMVHEGDMIAPKIENKEPLKEAIGDFVSSVLLKRKPLISGHDTEKTIKILELAQISISQNGKCVPIELT
ncbi:MAG: Oxidoreductase [Candidatus Levybacteria bacterium]|nr:Oxidoreductase [Candidatus Levybacteria bacterium]